MRRLGSSYLAMRPLHICPRGPGFADRETLVLLAVWALHSLVGAVHIPVLRRQSVRVTAYSPSASCSDLCLFHTLAWLSIATTRADSAWAAGATWVCTASVHSVNISWAVLQVGLSTPSTAARRKHTTS